MIHQTLHILLYVKEEKRIRVSADVNCQNQNTRLGSHINILQQNGKKGKQASCQRDREREGVCDFALPENEVGVHCKMAAWERVAMRTCTLKLFVLETIQIAKGGLGRECERKIH